MTQQGLDFGRADRLSRAYRKVLNAVADAVAALGLDVAAGACDARRSELSDAISGRENRYLRVEWLMAITDKAPDPFKSAILTALVDWQGLSLLVPRPLTPAEKLARYERILCERLGQAGVEIIREVER